MRKRFEDIVCNVFAISSSSNTSINGKYPPCYSNVSIIWFAFSKHLICTVYVSPLRDCYSLKPPPYWLNKQSFHHTTCESFAKRTANNIWYMSAKSVGWFNSHKTFYCKISQSLQDARSLDSLWNLAGAAAILLKKKTLARFHNQREILTADLVNSRLRNLTIRSLMWYQHQDPPRSYHSVVKCIAKWHMTRQLERKVDLRSYTYCPLTHWGRDNMATIFQTFSNANAFSWMKIYEFRLRFHWISFLLVHLTLFQHWFR